MPLLRKERFRLLSVSVGLDNSLLPPPWWFVGSLHNFFLNFHSPKEKIPNYPLFIFYYFFLFTFLCGMDVSCHFGHFSDSNQQICHPPPQKKTNKQTKDKATKYTRQCTSPCWFYIKLWVQWNKSILLLCSFCKNVTRKWKKPRWFCV